MPYPETSPARCDSPDAEATALLAAWQRGDTAAGKQLVRSHERAVARFFFNKVFREADIIFLSRQVFDLVRRREHAPIDLRAALYRQAFRVLRDYLQSGRDDDVSSISAESLGTCIDDTLSRDRRPIVVALRRLTLLQQVALELTHWEQLTPAQLSMVLGIPPGDIRTHIRHAAIRVEAELRAANRHEHAVTRLN